MATPVWINRWTFLVRHPVSGRSQTVTIPGADKLERSRLQAIVDWQTEQTLTELAGPEVNVRAKPFSKNDQHDLGKTLDGIEATKGKIAETGKGRYL